jgi:hypothetical protein
MRIADPPPEQQQKVREYNRQRKRDSREKQQAERESTLIAAWEAERARELNAQEQGYRNRAGRCFFGEVRPGVDADSIADALQVAREMARALNSQDIQPGETLYDFERRVFHDWTGHDAPFLNRQTQQLSPGWGGDYWEDHCGGFDKCWKPLPGAKKNIDVTSLPAMPPVAPEWKPPAPVEPQEITPSDEEIRETGRVQLLRQLDPSIQQDARRYLEGELWR